MDARAHFMMLARYNAWGTRALFEHIDALPEADYRRDCGLYALTAIDHACPEIDPIWMLRAESANP